jgi:RNA polymerase sigma-70 factor (ECF subfamily)
MTYSQTNFESLVDDFKEMVFNVSLHYFYNREDAEDISQQVFIDIFEQFPGFKGDSDIKTWIYQITVNTCKEELRYRYRKKRNWKKTLFLSDLGDKKEQESIVEAFGNHPEIELEQQELGRVMQREILKLSEKQQTAFVLTQMEQLSYEEAARVMKSTVSSVESLVFRARQNLKKSLSDVYDEWFD